MKSKTKIIISCGIVLFLTIAVLVWSWSTGCFDNFLINDQQKHEDLLMILIKTTEKEHFLSQLERRWIRYFVENKNDKDVVLFQNGHAEFVNGDILCWAYHNAQIRIPAIPEKIIYELKNSKAASAEVEKRFGIPSSMVLDKEGNFTFTYIFLRDENAKRTDGQYNASLTIWFDDYKINNYSYTVIDDLNKKTIDELI
jgi:hypothetical protein